MTNKKLAFLILGIMLIVIYSPFMSLWALETVFNFKIVYNFWSWLAMTWVHLIIFLARSFSSTTITTINAQVPPGTLPSTTPPAE